jgi:SAM-dependent methyltransferase
MNEDLQRLDYGEPITVRKLQELFEQKEPNVSSTIAAEDIYAKYRDHYFNVGQSALQCVKLAMLAAGKREVERVLDLPCGHGRVLRTIRAAFPEAQITACDILHDGVDFCAKEFDAIPVYSRELPEDIRIDGKFDLIWCGSLLTHLDADRWLGFINLFNSLLAPKGIAVVTVCGRWIVERMRRGEENYGLKPDKTQKLLNEYDREGFGFGNYFHSTDYGISASSPSWVCSRLEKIEDIRLLNLTERGWDNHIDVVSYVKSS